MFGKTISTIAAVAIVVFAGVATAPTATAGAADIYKGKTAKIMFGFSVGATYGQYSLMLSQFLPRFIPGNPNIIIQSMPGAGGMKVSNYAANVLTKSGLGLFTPPNSIVVNQLLRGKGARYKAQEFYLAR